MKILHINTSDINGGAARAAHRLHQALLDAETNSKMLVQTKASDDYTVLGPDTKTQKAISRMRPVLDETAVWIYRNREPKIFSPAMMPFSGIISKIKTFKPDIVHLHWIAGGMVRIEDLARINRPIVWSLHDMWAFTGGCHYDDECNRYLKSCGTCPVLNSKRKNDLSARIFKRKANIFRKIPNISIVGLSNWLSDCARKSHLLKNKPVIHLPNPIATDIYKPLDKITARELLGLPVNSKLVLFGAMNATKDKRKGFSKLKDAMPIIRSKNLEFMVFGSGKPQDKPEFAFTTHYLGNLHDDLSLRVVFSAADVMVVPSLQENLSNVIMESLACGTPAVGFNIGGNPDMIEHKINGYLAMPFDPNDLARGIEWVLDHPDPETLARSAREKVLREFDSRVVAEKYLELYEQVLKEQ